MFKIKSVFILLVFVALSCNTSTSKDQKLAEVSTLPFFNKPDWTPEWISVSDSNYNKIHTIPAFSFIDQNGNTVNEKNVDGKIYVSNFFFTKCRSICPKMTSNMFLLQQYFKNDNAVLFLSHSVTPESDSVPILKAYSYLNKVDYYKWRLLTGSKKEIYTLARQQYFAGDSIGVYQSDKDFLHTENFILVDKHRRIRGVYNGTLLVEIDRIKEDIEMLKNEVY
jgi:protein SCO1/2